MLGTEKRKSDKLVTRYRVEYTTGGEGGIPS
jgi:hypothetical protein